MLIFCSPVVYRLFFEGSLIIVNIWASKLKKQQNSYYVFDVMLGILMYILRLQTSDPNDVPILANFRCLRDIRVVVAWWHPQIDCFNNTTEKTGDKLNSPISKGRYISLCVE